MTATCLRKKMEDKVVAGCRRRFARFHTQTKPERFYIPKKLKVLAEIEACLLLVYF